MTERVTNVNGGDAEEPRELGATAAANGQGFFFL